MNLINKNEGRLFKVAAVISVLVWLAVVIATFGMLLAFVALFALLHTFAASLFISRIKGNSVKITSSQFPDLHAALEECASKLGMTKVPEAYVMNGNGMFNAFATKFLRTNYLILLSPILDSLTDKPEAINFYLGHELGHIKRKHVLKSLFLIPASILPVFGQAYQRACEYTCDLHGLACCNNAQEAQQALLVIAAGQTRWKDVNIQAFIEQADDSGQFWMSLDELTQSHPWLAKRCIYLEAMANNQEPVFPSRNPFAVVVALLIPNFLPDKTVNLFIVLYMAFIIGFVGMAAKNNAKVDSHASYSSLNGYSYDHEE